MERKVSKKTISAIPTVAAWGSCHRQIGEPENDPEKPDGKEWLFPISLYFRQ